MSRPKVPEFAFGGLNTRAQSTGLPLLELTTLQDMRVIGTDLVQRYGIYRLSQLTGNFSAFDFTAASSEACVRSCDTRVWALGLYWTLELAIEPDTVAGTQGVLCVGHTTPAIIIDITGGNIRARVWDSAGTATTLTVGTAATSVQTIQLVRSGAVLSSRLNNGTAVTGAMSATLLTRSPLGQLRVANDDSGNYYDGTICYVRLFSYAKANHNDRLIRNPAPRASYCLADYDFNASAANLVYDRSRYEDHMVAQNTPTEIATLCHNAAPVRALSMSVDVETNRKQLLAAAGGKYYLGTVD